jgi:hypothetical protein
MKKIFALTLACLTSSAIGMDQEQLENENIQPVVAIDQKQESTAVAPDTITEGAIIATSNQPQNMISSSPETILKSALYEGCLNSAILTNDAPSSFRALAYLKSNNPDFDLSKFEKVARAQQTILEKQNVKNPIVQSMLKQNAHIRTMLENADRSIVTWELLSLFFLANTIFLNDGTVDRFAHASTVIQKLNHSGSDEAVGIIADVLKSRKAYLESCNAAIENIHTKLAPVLPGHVNLEAFCLDKDATEAKNKIMLLTKMEQLVDQLKEQKP